MDVGALFEDPTIVEVSAVHTERPKGVKPVDLAKVWRIDVETARHTLDITNQLKQQETDGNLSHNFSTNDRMLRYWRINSHFFTNTFFVTKRAKYTRGNTCMQLFVSDKVFVFVVPMKSKGEFPSALKSFAKEIGVPTTLILDPYREQTSRKVRKFCNNIGITLRILEEHTQWANLDGLYIGITKESVRKNMRESDSPLVLWDSSNRDAFHQWAFSTDIFFFAKRAKSTRESLCIRKRNCFCRDNEVEREVTIGPQFFC